MNERPSTPASVRAVAPTAQIFTRDETSRATLRQALAGLGLRDADFIDGDIETAIATLSKQPSPRLLVVDISGVEDPSVRVGELANVCEPNTGVVLIGDRNDIVLYRNLKYAGVVEYFFKPLVVTLVTRTFEGVLTGHAVAPTPRTGKLVYMLGVRGGVGATTIGVHTAWSLAELRQRWVMLLDLDLQGGDAALQLDVTPSHALREAFVHPDRVDKLFLERAVIHVENRIDLLASLEPLGDSAVFEEAALLTLLEKLLARYRFVFVDLPPAVGGRMMRALHLPSTCVLISTGTLVSARDVSRWQEWIGENTPDRTTLHVLNKHGAPGSLSDAEFLRAAGRAPDIVIPCDRDISAAGMLGIKGTGHHGALKRHLAPLIRHLSGEQMQTQRSVLRRLFG